MPTAFSQLDCNETIACERPTLISRDTPSHHESSDMELKDLSSNWKKLQLTLKQNNVALNEQLSTGGRDRKRDLKRKRADRGPLRSQSTRYPNTKRRKATAKIEDSMSRQDAAVPPQSRPTIRSVAPSGSAPFVADRVNEGLSQTTEVGKYVAIDCEMVGVGPNPDRESSLARVSAVNFHGEQVYDSYVKQKEEVTDWRTHVSGILPKHMAEARTLEQVQADIAALLDGNILVGHAIRNDLDAMKLGHPRRDIRDTARHPPFRKFAGGGSPRLKVLAAELLGIQIQSGEHSSIEDARACMLLFRQDKEAFEREHAKKWPALTKPRTNSEESGEKKARKKKKKKKK